MIKTTQKVRVRENSIVARIAAWKLRAPNMAITLGSTIYLYKASRQELLENQRWLRHELKHIEQYKRLGPFRFFWKYLWYSIRYGYHNNPMEIEARLAESDEEELAGLFEFN